MRNKLKISEEASKKLKFLSNKLDLRRNIICRVAVAESLTNSNSISEFEPSDSQGLEFNRYTLTGDQDLIFKSLIIQHEHKKIDEDEFFSVYFRKHIERGLNSLYDKYQKINSPVDFLLKLANTEN